MRFLLPLFAVLSLPLAARANEPTAAVKGYFEALGRQDFNRALAYCDGEAAGRTSRMFERLRTEAAAHNARVEVQVKRLDVRNPGSAEPGRGVPVPVAFHIDVVGKKWCFSKTRKLDGEARFYVDPARPDRIVAIEGNLGE